MKNLTPAMKQYLEIKGENEDAILFFRMGDFYEMFFDDATVASRQLGIALTSRDKDRKIPMCGIPFHAAKGYIGKLIKEGFKVALCEQLEDPLEAKGIVKRAVTRVITPGVALEEEYLDSRGNNYIAAAALSKNRAGLAFMDVLTGEFRVADLTEGDALIDEIKKVQPKELLIEEGREASLKNGSDPLSLISLRKLSTLPKYDFLHKTAFERLTSHFKLPSLDGFGCSGMEPGIRAAGALLYYVKETQKAGLDHVMQITPYYPDEHLVIDHSSRRNLELTENLRTGEKSGTLLALLDKTRTSMGGRRLRKWINYPLVDVESVEERLSGLQDLVEDRGVLEELQEALTEVYDLERLVGRVSMGVANPRDLVALKNSLKKVPVIEVASGKFSSPFLVRISTSLDSVEEASALIESSINDEPPLNVKDCGVIKAGYSKELDELRDIGTGGKSWIAEFEARERERTGNSILKVGYNKVFGYYIEISKSKLDNIPKDYIRKQTLVSAERFITPKLKECEDKILSSEERARALEAELFTKIRDELKEYSERIQASADTVSTLDAAASLAEVALKRGYTRPELVTDDSIYIEEGRHPVIEASMDEGFVPNDLKFDPTARIHIITGPNMAGKSTFMRQAAIIVLMAQMGSFVPAKRARIGIVDRIFTRVGASDDLSKGQSTFMVEMNETANILNNATDRSLVILDEIGRGTSTFDGLSIAWAVAEYLHDRPGRMAKTLFATHYHELTELSLTKELVKNYNISVKEWGGEIVFLRKVVPGGASRSYGIQVAKLAGLPAEVLARADEILRNLESGEIDETGEPRLATGHHPRNRTGSKDTDAEPVQPTLTNLFAEESRVKNYLDELNLESTTPLDALKALYRLKELLKS